MAPLFSKVDLNKLWHDVQNEQTLIYAKFGKELFNISKVIGLKKVAQFFDSQCICVFGDTKRCSIQSIQKTSLFVFCITC